MNGSEKRNGRGAGEKERYPRLEKKPFVIGAVAAIVLTAFLFAALIFAAGHPELWEQETGAPQTADSAAEMLP